jgi:hypothetical protein
MFNLFKKKPSMSEKTAFLKEKRLFMQEKALISGIKGKENTTKLTQLQRQLNALEEARKAVEATAPKHPFVQVLENPTVQDLIKAAVVKYMGGKIKVQGDNELIEMYQQLPEDIKQKAKGFILEYIGAKK